MTQTIYEAAGRASVLELGASVARAMPWSSSWAEKKYATAKAYNSPMTKAHGDPWNTFTRGTVYLER
jgi:hypothetical protein